MIVLRRRLVFWLIKAYIKKSKKILILSFMAGLLIFFAIIFGGKYIRAVLSFNRQPVVGLVGSYEQDKMPPAVVDKLSHGLTRVEENASVKTDLAESYVVEQGGKVYKFVLRDGIIFNDGSTLESDDIEYHFSDVKVERPDKKTIVFVLNDPYAPFLATVSRPVFKKGFSGIGEYNIRDIELNGSFVQNLTLSRKDNRFEKLKYIFYPTEDALKTAFALGEITEAHGVTDISFQDTSFDKFPGTSVKSKTNYKSLVTLFYNTADGTLSDRKIRLGLNYALPDDFDNGEDAHLPYPPVSVYYNKDIAPRQQDIERAKILMPEGSLELSIKTLKKYYKSAEQIAKAWEKIGVKVKIEEVDQVPDRFQIFLGDFNMPLDPDQYALWHSGQGSNITRFKNLRIDKLLEDGRKTTKVNERKKIYNDFQRFLLEEMPASFLYFPKEYAVIRR
jgi:ABC-type transport system substrate-binding protein